MATPTSGREFEHDVVVVGGCGHVGLPLAVAFAERAASVVIYDVSESAVESELSLYLVHCLEQKFDLPAMTVGILGMAFKGGSDDIRSSLSYKLKRILEFKAGPVLCADPYVTADENLLPQEEVITRSGLLIIATPHPQYRDLRTGKPVADIWNVLGGGVLI